MDARFAMFWARITKRRPRNAARSRRAAPGFAPGIAGEPPAARFLSHDPEDAGPPKPKSSPARPSIDQSGCRGTCRAAAPRASPRLGRRGRRLAAKNVAAVGGDGDRSEFTEASEFENDGNELVADVVVISTPTSIARRTELGPPDESDPLSRSKPSQKPSALSHSAAAAADMTFTTSLSPKRLPSRTPTQNGGAFVSEMASSTRAPARTKARA